MHAVSSHSPSSAPGRSEAVSSHALSSSPGRSEFVLSAVALVPGEIALSWRDEHPFATTYALIRRRRGGIWSARATLPATASSFVDDQVDLNEGCEYPVCRLETGQLPLETRQLVSKLAEVDMLRLSA